MVAAARRYELLTPLVDESLKAGARQAAAVRLDVKSGEGLSDAVATLSSMQGEPCLVNNAGVGRFSSFAETDLDDHIDQLEINLAGIMRATHAFLPVALVHGSGVVINVLSVAADHVFSHAAVYSATKAGARQFGKCLAAEYRHQGLRVSNVLPGATDTELWGEECPPRDKMLRPEAVAKAIVDLIETPADRMVEEIVLTPPGGIL